MNRAARRRLQREKEKLGDSPDRYKNKLTTRKDVSIMLAMHHRLYIKTLELRLEWLEQPWYVRLWLQLTGRKPDWREVQAEIQSQTPEEETDDE